MNFRLSRLAQEDITQIHDFTLAEWGEEQALQYISRLLDVLEEIKLAPDRWRLRPDIYPGSRVRVCGRHLIIYRVQNDIVEFSRILHGAMKIGDHIPTNFMGTQDE
jgi:toxin ParE1/3/4